MSSEKQTRRRPHEVRKLLLDAAEKVFSAKGFENATVDDIIKAAGVSPSVYYRNFRTKSALYRAAVLEPFVEFIADFRPSWQGSFAGAYGPEDEIELLSKFYNSLYTRLSAHRDVLVALLSTESLVDEDGDVEVSSVFDSVFDELRSWAMVESEQWAPPADMELIHRLMVSMVSGLVLFKDWYAPSTVGKSRERVIDAMTRLTLFGVKNIDSADPATPDGKRQRDPASRKKAAPSRR